VITNNNNSMAKGKERKGEENVPILFVVVDENE
jgi:hypothetical protein